MLFLEMETAHLARIVFGIRVEIANVLEMGTSQIHI